MSKTVLASRLAGLSESATLALNAHAKQLAESGETIYNLTAGELASDTPKYIQSYVAGKLELNKYTPVAGLSELREQIAQNAREFYKLGWIKTENVIVTAGVKPALYLSLLSLINPGDEVIVPSPAWLSYYHLIELAGGRVVEAPLTKRFDLDVEAIMSRVSGRTKAIIINSPQNPSGAIFSDFCLEDLATRLKGSPITVMSDDIYAKLVYADNFSLVASHGFENIVILNGFSKSQALTGWRIGYAIAEASLTQAMINLQSHLLGNAALPSQEAGLAALAGGDKPPEITLLALKRQRQLVIEELSKVPQLSYHPPEGAFYVFIDIRSVTNLSSAEWCEQLLSKTGVALVPGEAFKAPGFVRLSFVASEATLKPALKKLIDFVSEKDNS